MKRTGLSDVEKYAKARRRRHNWYKVVTCMAAVVVFCITYALILPAITLEKEDQSTPGSSVESYEPQAGGETKTGERIVLPDESDPAGNEPIPASEAGEPLGDTVPVSLETYIEKAEIKYQPEGSETWTVVGEDEIPADTMLQLTLSYVGLPIGELEDSNYQLQYQLPGHFRDGSVAGGTIYDGSGQAIATVTVSDDKESVIVSFDPNWIETQKKDDNGNPKDNPTLKGNMTVYVKPNLPELPDNGRDKVTIGKVDYEINYGKDPLARYGEISIEKANEPKVVETEDGDYLQYTVTVTAGRDGSKGVFVKDTIAENAQWTTGKYKIITTGETIIHNDDAKTFTWTIGDMSANETRTLTYQVKLADGYTGGKTPENENIKNKAELYTTGADSKDIYLRGEKETTFAPKVGLSISKAITEKVADAEKGGYWLTYTITVGAKADNNYTLDHLWLRDAIDGSIWDPSGIGTTNAKYRPYMYYVGDSFTEGFVPEYTDLDERHNEAFLMNLGSLKPGEKKTFTYKIYVDAEAIVQAGTQDLKVQNRAAVFPSEDSAKNHSTESGQYYEALSNITNNNLGHKAWLRKMQTSSEPSTDQKNITIPENSCLYNATNTGVTSMTDTSGSFTVPAGSYEYHVIVNEAGNWNMSKTCMTDTLTPAKFMEYKGYVRVDAYTIDTKTDAGTDAEALNRFNDMTPASTAWINIDGRSTFQFKPSDIDMNGTYAYRLTYYAAPKNTDQFTTTVAKNEFTLTEDVQFGEGGEDVPKYDIKEVSAETTVTIRGNNYFTAKKSSWYYEPDVAATGKGSIYWLIQIDGKTIPAGTQIKDDWSHSPNPMTNSAVVSVFTTTEQIADAYDTITEWQANASSRQSVQYTIQKDDSARYHIVTLSEQVTLGEGTHLYLILKTNLPDALNNTNRDLKIYKNDLYTLSPEQNSSWVHWNQARKVVFKKHGIFKELGKAFTYDGNQISDLTVWSESVKVDGKNNLNSGVRVEDLDGKGIYMAWQIQINHDQSLNGDYLLEETIPEGMTPVCVRYYWNGKSNSGKFSHGFSPALDTSWEQKTSNNSGIAVPYAIKGQNMIWQVKIWDTQSINDRTEDSPESLRDHYAIEYQIICKVTDPDVLLAGKEKSFNNKVNLYKLEDTDRKLISSDMDAVRVSYKNITKEGNRVDKNSLRYPYTIHVNSLGDDLIKNGTTIDLIDEMGDCLIPDPTSVTVANEKTGETLTNDAYKVAVDGHKMTITLPDNLPLKITYEAIIQAKPDTKITITNNAYWSGYDKGGGSGTTSTENSYTITGTVETETNPAITVKKADQNDAAKLLSDAVFSLAPVTSVNKDGTVVTEDAVTGTTGTDGTYKFKETADSKALSYNTIYELKETKAPNGYVTDPTPHYIVVIRGNDTDEQAEMTDEAVRAQLDKIAVNDAQKHAHYTSSSYELMIYNHKGEIHIDKQFEDAVGTKIDGTISGTYHFGLYEGIDGEGKPTGAMLQEIVLVYSADGLSNQINMFKDLTIGKTYYVYELDENKQPITNGGRFTLDGKAFRTYYGSNESGDNPNGTNPAAITLTNDSPSQTVTIRNRMNYAMLPETGGNGTALYAVSGLGVLLAAGFLLITKKRMRIGA